MKSGQVNVCWACCAFHDVRLAVVSFTLCAYCKCAAFATGSSADKRDCREELWVHRIALATASAAAALWSVADVSRAARLACRRRA